MFNFNFLIRFPCKFHFSVHVMKVSRSFDSLFIVTPHSKIGNIRLSHLQNMPFLYL